MDTLVLDWETYYSTEFTLSKLTTESYVRDPRFEEILLGIKVNDTPAFWIMPDRAAHFLAKEVDWANTALICHHSHFDGLILSHHHGIKPAMHIDTLSMARILDGPKAGNSLEELCIRHGIGRKGNYVTFAKGKHAADFTAAERNEYGQYCINDCERTYDLAQIFMEQMPAEELQVVDTVIRMFTEPVFLGNAPQLAGAVASERQRKIDVLRRIGLLCPECGGDGRNPTLPLLLLPRMPTDEEVQCKKCEGTGVDKKTIGSNEKLANLFRECGVEPGMKQGKPNPDGSEKLIYAFAKTDPAMQELLEDEYEDVRFLAEARITVKSSIIETRAERYQHCAERGAMPVYVSYGAAHTFRMGGGDSMNWLNISSKHNENRPELSVIAASIMAPPGHKVITADSGQGEARITAWLAGQQDLVEAFAQGRDVYSEHASTIYGRHVDRKLEIVQPDGKIMKPDHIPGQLGKVCLAEGTMVVTDTGTKPIECVTIKDRLWDGDQWVRHQGLIFQGVKETVEAASLKATMDHEILTGRGWREWSEVITNHSLFQSALNLASLPSSDGGGVLPPEDHTNISRSVGALVGQKHTSRDTRYSQEDQLDVMPARKRRPQRSDGGVIQRLWRILTIDLDFSAGWSQPSRDAITRKIETSNTTASAVLSYPPHGVRTNQNSFGTSKLALDGMTQFWRWTGSKLTGITNLAIFGSSPVQSTCKTNGKSQPCSAGFKNLKQKLRTYDLACSGPRNRFTVLTDQGPLIVHNCILGMGFGMGWAKASAELLKGMLGAPPIQFSMADMEMLQVDPSRFFNNPGKVKQVSEMPSRLNLNDRLIHCATANALIDRYRTRYERIPKYWSLMDDVINAMIDGREMVFGAHGVMRTAKDKIWMPNGLAMRYDGISRDEHGQASYFNGRNRTKLYGALLVENTVQCLHYCIVSRQLLEIGKLLKVALTTYDDVVTVVPEAAAPDALAFMVQEMSKTPAWATGLPLIGEGKIGDTLKGSS